MHTQQLRAQHEVLPELPSQAVPPLPIVPLRLEGIGPASPDQTPLRAGDLCPFCRVERLDYDGLLNLSCPRCGGNFSGGCYT